MIGTGERAYAYAKACGIIGKSFIGRNMINLETVNRLSELDRMIFPTAYQALPEKSLLFDLEKRIIDRAVHSIISVVECFSNPPEFFSLLIRGYEYADIKRTLEASLDGEKTAPAHTDIGRFQTVNFDAWPDIREMIKGTEFDFLLDKEGILAWELGGFTLQTMLSVRYYSALWKSLLSLPGKDRKVAERILSDEISLKNACWALRLRSYYQMPAEEVKSHLIDIPIKTSGPGARSLADDAIRSLEFPLDNHAAWSSWRWREFLNPVSDGMGYSRSPAEGAGSVWHWQADPRYFQNASSRYLYRLARHHFHHSPFSMDSIFCFIKLKQMEEDILTSGAEGLGMHMSGRDIVSMLELAS